VLLRHSRPPLTYSTQETKCRNLENTFRRGSPAGLRSHVKGHDGFQTHRRARSISETCQPSHLFVQLAVNSTNISAIQSVVHPTIISRHFWPALEPSELVMPGQFKTYDFNPYSPFFF